MVSRVDAASALADLTELSSQVEAAVVLDANGRIVAATGGGDERLARAATELVRVSTERLGRTLTEVEARFRDGSVFVVRGDGHDVAARTRPRPHSALVRHDLAACLSSLEPAPGEAAGA